MLRKYPKSITRFLQIPATLGNATMHLDEGVIMSTCTWIMKTTAPPTSSGWGHHSKKVACNAAEGGLLAIHVSSVHVVASTNATIKFGQLPKGKP